MKLLCLILSALTRALLALRYSIKISDPDGVLKKRPGKGRAILFLPTHPAEIDPIILSTILMRKYAPRPVVVEHFYFLPGAMSFLKLLRAIPIPDFERSASSWKIAKGEKTQEVVRKGVKDGDSFLIYPAGHLRRGPREIVGGSSFIHSMIQEFPDLQIVMIRTKGLWGSMFSRAITGNTPDFWKNFVKGIMIALKNGIFFIPKRKVQIDLKLAGADFPRQGSRLDVNKYLEAWYNEQGDEELKLVSYSFWKEDLLHVTAKEEKRKSEYHDIPDEMRLAIAKKVGEITGKNPEEITLEMDLSSDLGLDSLDVAVVHAFVDEKYHIGPFAPAELTTVGDFCEAALGRKVTSTSLTEISHDKEWAKEPERLEVKPPVGETIQEAFLNTCKRMGKAHACADGRTPPLTYKRLKIAACVLAHKIKKYEGSHVGILLPSSVGVYVTTMATLLAGKIPVMLNWTVGRRSLEFADEIADFSVVLSSRKFLDKVDQLDLGSLETKLVLLEDVKKEISLLDKLKGALFTPKVSAKGSDTAVLLFTSGTETKPKGVPLSHCNILENQKAATQVIDIHKEDILYSVLPPFHSFGFSMTGLLPLLFGFRVFYSPDPLDSHAMARDAQKWGITFFCLAPSFYKNLFRVAKPEQLKTVRLFVSGAEKASQDLFDFVKNLGPQHHMIEGYGITECAPAVALTPIGVEPRGVGKPIPGTHLMCINPETLEPLPQGERGEVIISGPGVFDGYLGVNRDPFVYIDGKKWYRSGDLGHIDEEGYLILGGRISRFVKIGGEMVSLTAVEDALSDLMPPHEEEKPTHAIAAHEEAGGKATITLFTTTPIPVEKVNASLREKGFGRIVKVAHVKEVDEIPLTGTGKVAYRQLNELAAV